MKYILFVCAILCAGTSFSQSKKKQIESLQRELDLAKTQLDSVDFRLDSLQRVNWQLENTMLEQEDTINLLREAAKEQDKQTKLQLVEMDRLNERIRELESKQEKPATPKVEKNTTSNPTVKPGTNHANINKAPSGNPFGTGGGSGSSGAGAAGFGTDSGGGSETETKIDYGTRTRLNNVDVQKIPIETDVKIAYKLTIDAEGNVVAFTYYGSKTTTTDLTLINKIGYEIKKQVKYAKKPNAPLVYVDYTVNVKAN